MITGVLKVKNHNITTLDTPNTFLQTKISQSSKNIIMKIRGALVDILLTICSRVYDNYLICERNSKVVYVRMLQALYETMIVSMLCYNIFIKDITTIGFN